MDRGGLVELLRKLNKEAVLCIDMVHGQDRDSRDHGPNWMSLREQVTQFLKGQPEFEQNVMVRSGQGASSLIVTVPDRLLRRSVAETPEAAVSWLERILATRKADGLYVLPIWGVQVMDAVRLTERVEIVRLSCLPPSAQKQALVSGHLQGTYPGFPINAMSFEAPSVALIARTQIEPVLFDPSREPLGEFSTENIPLEDICLCLTLIGPSMPIPMMRWFQFSDPDLQEVCLSGSSSSHLEINPHFGHMPTMLDELSVGTLVSKYLALPEPLKKRIRIALQRLNQSMRRTETGDKAVDLCVALETLVGDRSPGELRWKVSLRSALLSSDKVVERVGNSRILQKLYDTRSALVHGGTAKDAQQEGVEAAVKICARVISSVVDSGHLPSDTDWNEFELQAPQSV